MEEGLTLGQLVRTTGTCEELGFGLSDVVKLRPGVSCKLLYSNTHNITPEAERL